jgi:hypothetical protein
MLGLRAGLADLRGQMPDADGGAAVEQRQLAAVNPILAIVDAGYS